MILQANSDEEIEKYNEIIKKILQERDLPLDLSKAIKQTPINIKLVNEYFSTMFLLI
jgi:hypothetical protein